MTKKLGDRLQELELKTPMVRDVVRITTIKYFEGRETPEEGWRRENGNAPYPTGEIFLIAFVDGPGPATFPAHNCDC